jgi:adenylyltransferase/sulfurtransferase
VLSGAKRLTALNPDTKVHSHKVRFENTNAVSLLKDYDLAVGAVDSFETRFLINKTCVSLKKPNVYGAVFRYEGQTSVFYPEGPCYQCLFPESPSREALPHCAGGGLLGVLPGVIGLVMATETIKAILGLGVSLAGRLLTYDLLKMKFREIMIRKRSDCPVCGHEGIGARD